MPRHVASLFIEEDRADLNRLVEACIKEMVDFVAHNIDMEIILSWDKPAIAAHMRSLIAHVIDSDPNRYAEIMKQYLTGELTYRIVARSYFD